MDQQVAAAIRAVRRRRGLRQADVARMAGVSSATVSRLEGGRIDAVTIAAATRVAATLGIRLDLVARWRGGELDRLINAGHSAMHELVARRLAAAPGWQRAAEVSFSIYGERGVIDVLAWHAGRKMLLAIELKTAIVDIQDLIGSIDRKRRLAQRIARERGWAADGASTSTWVVVADTRTNRARVAAHATLLRGTFPTDGRHMPGWLLDPREPLAALSFMQIVQHTNAGARGRPILRIQRRASAAEQEAPSTISAIGVAAKGPEAVPAAARRAGRARDGE